MKPWPAGVAALALATVGAAEEPWRDVTMKVEAPARGRPVRLAFPPVATEARQDVADVTVDFGGSPPQRVVRGDTEAVGVVFPDPPATVRAVCRFRARAKAAAVAIPALAAGPHPVPAAVEPYRLPSRRVPSRSPLVREVLRGAVGDPGGDAIRAIYDFIVRSVAVERGASPGALAALRDHRAAPAGADRALVTLLRAAGFPARPVTGLSLTAARGPRRRNWVEVWTGADWAPISAANRWYGEVPAGILTLVRGDRPLFAREGLGAVRFRIAVALSPQGPNESGPKRAPAGGSR